MSPEMQQELFRLSTTFHSDPAVIFRRVLEAIDRQYEGTMGMINLLDGDRIYYRELINPHPLFRQLRSLAIGDTY